jgi:hypothetical protein
VAVMEPPIEGMYEVATPPHVAGKKGQVPQRNWPLIVEWVRQRPHRVFCAPGVKTGDHDRLKTEYPDVEFLGTDHRIKKSPTGKEFQVVDVWVRYPKQDDDEG